MKTGVELIAEERKRQIEVEGWTAEHDDLHAHCELTTAAIAYATQATLRAENAVRDRGVRWVWTLDCWKPSADPVRNLVKAGALIAAEIDRLNGTQGTEGTQGPGPDKLQARITEMERLLTQLHLELTPVSFVSNAEYEAVRAALGKAIGADIKPDPNVQAPAYRKIEFPG